MPGRRIPPLTVTEKQRAILEQIIRRQTSPQHLVRRARIILLAAEGKRNRTIASDLRVNREMVSVWRGRWDAAYARLTVAEQNGNDLVAVIAEVLADEPRPGKPPTFRAEEIVQIVALACTDPAESDRAITHWTARELADEAIKRGIVPTISPQSVDRFLKGGSSQTPSVALLAEHKRNRPGGVC